MGRHKKRNQSVTLTDKHGTITGNLPAAAFAVPAPSPSVSLDAGPPKKATNVKFTHDEAVRLMASYLDERGKGETFTPTEEYPGAGKPWAGQCGKGHPCSPRLNGVKNKQGPCATCGAERRGATRSFSHSEAVALANRYLLGRGLGETFTPAEKYPGSNESPWAGKCEKGHSCRPSLNSLQRGQGACNTCGIERRAAAQRFSHDEAVRLMASYLDERGEGERFFPSEEYPGAHEPWAGTCGGGHSCQPTLNWVRGGSGICSECATYGYKKSKPGSLYLLEDELRGARIVQFGISNTVSRRLRKHRNTGFVSDPVLLIHGDGAAIAELEKSFKVEQKRRLIPNCTEEGLSFDGSTESFILEGSAALDFYNWIADRMREFEQAAA